MSDFLKISRLRKKFDGVHAVENLNFEVRKNSITGLIGPNGAGKTTVFNLITRFLKSDSGEIFFRGETLKNLPPRKIVDLGIARTFQQIRLWKNLTVRENLLLACSKKYDRWWDCFRRRNEADAERKIDEILEKFGITNLKKMHASDLSYGQSKLVELARTILTDAEILLLDEPAAGINPTLLKTIEKIIFDLKKSGKTLLVIEHNMPFLMKISDEIVAIDGGKFLCQGAPAVVQKNPKLLAAYLGDAREILKSEKC